MMPDVEPLRFPPREEPPVSPADPADGDSVCSGRRRACAFLNSPLPSVSTALHHIQELRVKVERCCQQTGKHVARFYQETDRYSQALSYRFHTKYPNLDSLMSTKLFVKGIAISTKESCPLSPLVKKINDVLEEVVYLVERLEADRQYAEESLLKEKRKKVFLEAEIESLSARQQHECDSMVEKEKETCSKDIAGLKRQVECAAAALGRVQATLSDTKVLNRRFHEDVNCAREQVTNMKEQLDHQEKLIQEINKTQAEADGEYLRVQSDLVTVKEEMKKLELETHKEKDLMNKELLVMKTELASQLTELQQLEERDKHLSAEIKDAENTVALTEEKCATMRKEIPKLEELEKEQACQISHLQGKIEDEMRVNRELEKQLNVLRQQLEDTKQKGEAEVSLIDEQLSSRRDAHAALGREHVEHERNVEKYKMNISESEEAVKQMLEQRKQMLQKIIDNDEQWGRARQEVTQVLALHSVTRAKLEEQERRTFLGEQRAREEMETLRKDLTGRVAQRQLLQGACAQITAQLHEQQRRSDLITQKLKDEFENAHSATKCLETKIENMKKWTSDVERMESDHKDKLANLQREHTLKLDQLSAAKDIETASVLRYDNILSKTSELQTETENLRDASDKIEENLQHMPEVVSKLQRAFEVAEFKDKSAALVMSTLQSDINNWQHGTQRSMQTHTAHIAARKKQMDGAKEALSVALNDNKLLAREYEDLKKILTRNKHETVCVLSESNAAHKSLHCYTQLSLLQKRMHKALVKYFRQRSLYIQSELDRCQSLSQETDQKIQAAQEGMSAEIQSISRTLASDASTSSGDTGMNKQVTVKMPSSQNAA